MALSIAELAPQDEKLQLLLEAIDSASRGTLQVVERRRSNQQATGSKRLRHRYAYCENCDKGFDVTKNTKPAEDIIQVSGLFS